MLHGRCAPLFLRSDQEFIEGVHLKSDLRALNEYFLERPGTAGDRDVWSFPDYPPESVAPLVSRLWNKYMGERRDERHADGVPRDRGKVIDEVDRMHRAPAIPLDRVEFDLTNPDAITLERRVRRGKGSWLQLPKDVR